MNSGLAHEEIKLHDRTNLRHTWKVDKPHFMNEREYCAAGQVGCPSHWRTFAICGTRERMEGHKTIESGCHMGHGNTPEEAIKDVTDKIKNLHPEDIVE